MARLLCPINLTRSPKRRETTIEGPCHHGDLLPLERQADTFVLISSVGVGIMKPMLNTPSQNKATPTRVQFICHAVANQLQHSFKEPCVTCCFKRGVFGVYKNVLVIWANRTKAERALSRQHASWTSSKKAAVRMANSTYAVGWFHDVC